MSHARRSIVILSAALALSGAWAHQRAARTSPGGTGDGLAAVEERLGVARQRSDDLRDALERCKRAVPGGQGVADVLDALESDLSDLGVDEVEWQIEPSSDGIPFRAVPVGLGFHASFSETHELLQRVSAYPRLCRVDSLRLRHGDDAGGAELRVSLRVVVFSRASDDLFGPETEPTG